MIDENSFKKLKKEKESSSFFSKMLYNLLIKSLLSIVLLLVALIYIMQSDSNKEKLKNTIYVNNISFAKIYNIYEKYLGDLIPFKSKNEEKTNLVSEEKLAYKKIDKYNNGYILTLNDNNSISSITSGIVIKVSKNDELLNIITIQNKNEVEITYGFLNELNIKLYDYVEKGELLGTSKNKLYLEFKKDNKYLSYEKYL